MKNDPRLNKFIWINGKEISYNDILTKDQKDFLLIDEFEVSTIQVIKSWLKGQKLFELQSSGSSGNPKKITVTRDQLEASARMTLEALKLKEGINSILCLNTKYTAGIMLVIRSLIGNFNLYALTPATKILTKLPMGLTVDLISVVPSQLYEIFNQNNYFTKFNNQSIILVGGAALPLELEKKSHDFPGRLYHTFGMAETLSHIALRKINGDDKSEYYETVGSVSVRADENGCLIIDAPHLFEKELITPDIVEILDSRHFLWKGRADHVIVSGGIKIQVEWLEREIENSFRKSGITNNFFISSSKDTKYGDKVILLVEDDKGVLRNDLILGILKEELEDYHMPKDIFLLPKFKYTETQKTDRINTRALINLPG